MGKPYKSLDDYLYKIPEQYRGNIVLLEPFKGNRTNILFTFYCGCKKEELLKSLIKRSSFDVCFECSKKNSKIYTCNYCCKQFTSLKFFQNCLKKCEDKYKNLTIDKDYVVCQLCNFHSKSLGAHVTKIHKISHEEYREKYGNLICANSSENYKECAKINGNWIVRAKEDGKDLTNYWDKVSKGVREAIMNNPEDRARRAMVMTKVNQSDVMRQKASETAKITSARKDIQAKRSLQLKKWRVNHRDDFYNQCIKKMIINYNSKPEKILFSHLKNLNNFSFKQNQFLKSDSFSCPSKRRQVDIVDKSKRIYVEFDGPLHFKPKFGIEILKKSKQKDKEVDEHILKHNWTLIRISYDQFIYKAKTLNKVKEDVSYFKQECLNEVNKILQENNPGIYRIGSAYQSTDS